MAGLGAQGVPAAPDLPGRAGPLKKNVGVWYLNARPERAAESDSVQFMAPRKAPKRRASVEIEEERAPVRARVALAEIEEEPVEPTEEELALERLLAQAPVPTRHVAAIPRLSGMDEARLARLAVDARAARETRETREEEARLAQVAREKEEARVAQVAREKEEARVAQVAREKEEARVAQEKREQQEKQDKTDTQKDCTEMLKKMVETTTSAINAMTNAMNAARPRTGWRFPNFYELVLIGILLVFLFAVACVLPWVFSIYQWVQYLWAPMVGSGACQACPPLPDMAIMCAEKNTAARAETNNYIQILNGEIQKLEQQLADSKNGCEARITEAKKRMMESRIAENKIAESKSAQSKIAECESKIAQCESKITEYEAKIAKHVLDAADRSHQHARAMQDLAAQHEAECNLPRAAAECKPCVAVECKPCAAPEEEVIWFRHERV